MVSVFILINCELGLEESVMSDLKSINEVKEVKRVSEAYDFLATVESTTIEELKEIITYKIRTIKYINATLVLIKIESVGSKDSDLSNSMDNPYLFEIRSANTRIQEKKDKDKAKLLLVIHFSAIVLLFSIGYISKNSILYGFGIVSIFLLLVTAMPVIRLYDWVTCEKCHSRMNARDRSPWICWNCNHSNWKPASSGEGM